MTVRLKCGHSKEDRTVHDKQAYCGRCFAVQDVIEHYGETAVKCVKCPYARKFGTDSTLAYRAAMRHQRATGHPIWVGPTLYRHTNQLPLFHI